MAHPHSVKSSDTRSGLSRYQLFRRRVQNSRKRKWTLFAFILIIIIPSVFYAGYFAHQHRVFPIRPFIKRTLVELGVSERILAKLRKSEIPKIELESHKIDVDTAYYGFEGRIYPLPTSANYGGIAEFGGGIVFVDGKGLIWHFKNGAFRSVSSKEIPNINGLDENTGDDLANLTGRFTVRDIEIIDDFVYASAIEYHASEDCITLSLFRTEILNSSEDSIEFGDWNKVFKTAPCLDRGDEGGKLIFIRAAGRIIRLSATHILLSVGDFGQDGVTNETRDHAQSSASHYGKTIKLDLATFTPTIFTTGHRNPQGLLLAESGMVIATEHGPQGGDELNLIIEGRNYGWPLVTFGTAYGEYGWPLDHGTKDHSGFEKPIYSWVPSIGISSLIQIRNKTLSNWDRDILVSSLYGSSLYRIEMDGLSPILVEPIYVGSRIRDIINYGNGFALQIDQEDQLIVLEPIP